MKVVVMGVSGCGKSTIGKLIASHCGAAFIDGDDLHPSENVTKMSQGIPLNDDDRWPWLDIVGQELRDRGACVIACSALKRSYRARILRLAPETVFIHLHGSRETLQERLENREDHFMPTTLLDSQLSTLENLAADEPGQQFDIQLDKEELFESICSWLESSRGKLQA